MELNIAEERAFLLKEQISAEQAKEKAWGAKMSVFGMLNSLLFRPKDDDVRIVKSEMRYEPFWHISCHREIEYDLRATYTVHIPTKNAHSVVLDVEPEQEFAVETGQITLTGVSRCRDENMQEIWVDAVAGTPQPTWQKYLLYPKDEITDLAAFHPENVVVVAPEVRASFVVRQQLGEMMQALQADTVHKELVEIKTVDLYFRPLFAYEYHWVSKDRRLTVEIDALTGELKNSTKSVGQSFSKMLTPELLFDVGADAVDLLIPGGGIAMKVGRAIAKRQEKA